VRNDISLLQMKSSTTSNNSKTSKDKADDATATKTTGDDDSIENMNGIFIIGFALCWAATAGGVYVGISVYPWAYPLTSGLYALSVLTVIESLGFFFIMKIAHEKPVRA
jgi:hypothetical protein